MTDNGKKTNVKTLREVLGDEAVPPDMKDYTDQAHLLECINRLIGFADSSFDKSDEKEKKKQAQSRIPSLTQEYKNSEQARGVFMKGMIALAEAADIASPYNAAQIGPMKELKSALEKIIQQQRDDVNDLGRGRILFNSIDEYKSLLKILGKAKKDGELSAFKTDKLKIVNEVRNYLEEPSGTGYAGSYNTNISVDLGHNRTAVVEMQLMPVELVETYDQSHAIYKLIGLQKSVPKALRTPEQVKLIDALTMANKALFDEMALRTGYVEFRKGETLKDKISLISTDGFDRSMDILEDTQAAIQRLKGTHAMDKDDSKYLWRKGTMEAITYAKTSLTFMRRYTKNKFPDFENTPKASNLDMS